MSLFLPLLPDVPPKTPPEKFTYSFDWMYAWGPGGRADFVGWRTQLRTHTSWRTDVSVAREYIAKANADPTVTKARASH